MLLKKGENKKRLRDRQVDKELDSEALGAPEKSRRILLLIISLVSVFFCAFQIYTGATMPLAPMNQRTIHFGFVLILVFLYDAQKRKHLGIRVIDYILVVISVGVNLYIHQNWVAIMSRSATLERLDIIVGFVLIAIVIYAAYRIVGIWMPVIAIVFLAYAYFGRNMPGLWKVTRLSLSRFIDYVSLSTEGVFGTCLGTSATFAFMFILYAQFLVDLGAGDFMIRLAESLFGSVRGGPAKISVVASGLFGSVSGSAVANVAGTGCVTIPMMKKAGFKNEFAGGTEAAASTGGAFMPPVMGTVAFIMSDLLSTSYRSICIAALVPAILYYLGVFITVDCEACKMNMKGLPKETLPSFWETFKSGWHYLLSLATLVLLMIVLQWSSTKSALCAMIVLVGAEVIKRLLFSHKEVSLRLFVDIFTKGAKGVLTIATATACAGIVVGVFTATGLNLRLSSLLIEMAGGSLALLLVFVMIGAIVMGMGLPTTPVYIILAVLVAPALIQKGVLPIAAHMFVLYYGVMAAVTPPVGLAFYVASGLAEASPMKTGLNASKLAIMGFILPFIFVYNPGLLLQTPFLQALPVIATTLLAVFAIAFTFEGYCMGNINILNRILFGIAAVLLATPETMTDIAGVVLFAALVIMRLILARKHKSATGLYVTGDGSRPLKKSK